MALTLHDLIEELFVVKTIPQMSTVTVTGGLPFKLLAKNNPNRLSLIMSNVGDNPVYINYNRSAGLKEGLMLVPNGGYLSLLWSEDFDTVGWDVYAHAISGDSTIILLEIISI